MVWSQDNLTIVASETDFSNQQRISYQQAAGFIPAVSRRSSAHYSLSITYNYSLKNRAPPTISCNTTIFNDIHTRWPLGHWCEELVIPCAMGAMGNQAVLQNQSPISATAFRDSSTVGGDVKIPAMEGIYQLV
jgi:hypothetical protein